MSGKTKTLFTWLAFMAIALISACGLFGSDARDTTISPPNQENSVEPTASPTPRSFTATQFLEYAKANEAELSKMLTDNEIIISGDVWSGGNSGSGTASFEFYSLAGRIACSGYTNKIDAAKLNLLERSAGDYLNKRTNKMPFVKAKGIYKKAFAPAASPNNFWRIVLEDCLILEVTP